MQRNRIYVYSNAKTIVVGTHNHTTLVYNAKAPRHTPRDFFCNNTLTNTYSGRTYTRNVQLQRRNTSRIAQTASRLWQSPRMSFRGAKRRGNPLNRNAIPVAIAIDRTCSRNYYRAENLCYQFIHGQKLPPQFRQIICLLFCVLCTQADKRTLIQGVLVNGMCLFGVRAATAARKRTPSLTYSTSERTSLVFSSANECHKKRTIAIYASAECCPPLRGHRGFPQGTQRGNGDRENT